MLEIYKFNEGSRWSRSAKLKIIDGIGATCARATGASRSQIEFVTKSGIKKRPRDNKIMMMMLCTSARSPRIQTRIYSTVFFFSLVLLAVSSCAPLHNITLRWIKFLFYIRREEKPREEGKKLRSRWYSIGIGWLNFRISFSGRWSARLSIDATRCLHKHFYPVSFFVAPKSPRINPPLGWLKSQFEFVCAAADEASSNLHLHEKKRIKLPRRMIILLTIYDAWRKA